jgi:hypothetical protein
VLTEDQLIDRLRAALERETEGIELPPSLLANVHRELLETPPAGRARRPRSRIAGGVLIGLAAAAAVAVVFVAVLLVGHEHAPSTTAATSRIPAGTSRLVAQAPDPRGGLHWGLRMVQTNSVSTCLQVGRVRSGVFGGIGQDGSFSNDGRFHPVAPRAAGPGLCTGDDAHGNAYMNVFSLEAPASGGYDMAHGPCPASRRSSELTDCPPKDLRDLAYGLLGPDAVSITYPAADGHTVTVPTGLDGAYLVVLPGTTESCTTEGPGGRGRGCIGGAGEITTGALQSGVLTAVTYRDGHVCHLPVPTRLGTPQANCPGVGYTPVPFHPPTVTASQVAAPVHARVFKAKQYCFRPSSSTVVIPCDRGVPRGYKRGASGVNPPEYLIHISFTARLAATNAHSVYEWSVDESSDNPNCSGGGGETDATTMTPIRAGEHVVVQTFASTCPGTYTGLVTYQPNGWPGHDTLSAGFAIRDGSLLVGRFTVTVH